MILPKKLDELIVECIKEMISLETIHENKFDINELDVFSLYNNNYTINISNDIFQKVFFKYINNHNFSLKQKETFYNIILIKINII